MNARDEALLRDELAYVRKQLFECQRANGEIALILAHTWGEQTGESINTSIEPLTDREKQIVAAALGIPRPSAAG